MNSVKKITKLTLAKLSSSRSNVLGSASIEGFLSSLGGGGEIGVDGFLFFSAWSFIFSCREEAKTHKNKKKHTLTFWRAYRN